MTMSNAQYRVGGGSRSYLTKRELARIVARPNVSEPYYIDVAVVSEHGSDCIEAQCYEVYADDETPDDYPDGDPYADHIIILPAGYEWTADGRRVVRCEAD